MPRREDIEARLPKYVQQRPEVPRRLRGLQPKVGEAQVALGTDLEALERTLSEAFARSDANETLSQRVRDLAKANRRRA